MSSNPVTVVGVGVEGWPDLGTAAREALLSAEVIVGSERQLALLPEQTTADRVPLPSPLVPGLPELLALSAARRLAVLASGDPMYFGIGATLVRRLGASAVRILPHVSSMSLACARLGWPTTEVEVVSVVGRPLALLHPAVQPGRRVLVLVGDGGGAEAVCDLLRGRGYGGSEVTLLERLGADDERRTSATAEQWPAGLHDPLAIVAVRCHAAPDVVVLPRTPGLPDDAFDHDGQITKREARALALAALAPVPGQLLWDVGAGSGSVGIEWMRIHPDCRAIAIEPREHRRQRIAVNANQLGVPGLRLVEGSAPAALAGLPEPDAVFIGGGVSVDGVVAACLAALNPGGRLVAAAVTLQSEAVLSDWYHRLGGTLTRISIERAGPLGSFTGWQPARPVVQWAYRKETT